MATLLFPQPTALQRLPRASFGGVEFPVNRVSMKCSLRHHVHEYPHAPGGAIEKLARKLYEVHVTALFHETFIQYPDLYPARLDRLRDLFETGTANDLVVPQVGTIKAVCINWSQSLEAKLQSGEQADFEFLEDQSQLFLVDALIRKSVVGISSSIDRYTVEAARSGVQGTIFDDIRDITNSILAFVDQGEAFLNLLESKVRGLQAILDETDRALEFLQHPENWRLWDAMRELWASNQKLLDNILDRQTPIAQFIVPMTMPIADVSSAIYGDATHAVELLQINNVDDAFAVPAGFRIRYYPAAIAA